MNTESSSNVVEPTLSVPLSESPVSGASQDAQILLDVAQHAEVLNYLQQAANTSACTVHGGNCDGHQSGCVTGDLVSGENISSDDTTVSNSPSPKKTKTKKYFI